MDCSLPDSSVHGILQAETLEWAATPFSRRPFRLGIKPPSALAVGFFTTKPPRKSPQTTIITYRRWNRTLCSGIRLPPLKSSLHPSTATQRYIVAYWKMGIKLTLLLKIILNNVCKVLRQAPGEWLINIRNLHHYHHLLHKMSNHMVTFPPCGGSHMRQCPSLPIFFY